MSKPPVLCVIGSRTRKAIKMLPVIVALRASQHLEPVVVVTGQHQHMVQPVLDIAGIVPDADLHVGNIHPAAATAGLSGLVATIMIRFDEVLRRCATASTAVGGAPPAM